MTPERLFSILNLVAMGAWALLVLLPRVRWTSTLVPVVVPSLLAVVYIALIAASLPWGEGGFSSLAAVRALFDNRWGLLAGWTHYLAFDLFIGGWEVRDAQRRGVPHLLIVPALVLTFLLGPAGWLFYLAIRSFAPGRVPADARPRRPSRHAAYRTRLPGRESTASGTCPACSPAPSHSHMNRYSLATGVAAIALAFVSCSGRQSTSGAGGHSAAANNGGGPTAWADIDTVTNDAAEAASYEGVDARGIPHYATVSLSSADSLLLRQAYGIEDPHRLYVSDSTEEGILKYDTARKRCLTCYVNSYRIGYQSVRRQGESWEQAEHRVSTTPARVFTGGANPSSTSTADLDPEVRPLAEAMLRDARAAGFRLRVVATYRSPLREAFLMAKGGGRTHTLTSNHSYGRALDVVIDDGNAGRPRTRQDWIAFRRWVTHYRTSTGESFHVLGRLDHTWDWAHVELPSPASRFDTIDEAIARARACLAAGATIPCNFPPHLPPHLDRSLVQ